MSQYGMIMNRISGIAVALYLAGDPGLEWLDGMGMNGAVVMATVIVLLVSPWLRAQFDH